jgi:hypothetical protein
MPQTGSSRVHYEFGWSRALISASIAVNIALFGASHQLGASLAAFGAGAIRTELGEYRVAFLIAGLLCLIAGASFLVVGRVLRAHAIDARTVTAPT